MKKAILAQKVLASVLAIGLGGFVLPLAAQANSGLKDEPQQVTDLGGIYYIGTNGAADNVVIIDRDLPDNNAGVIGGYAESGIVTNNRLTISDGEVGYIFGGYANNGNVTGNEVSISGGEVGYVCGGYGVSAIGNSVNISDGEVGNIYGGNANGFKSQATENSINISDGEVEYVCGGYVNGFESQTTGNIVWISGGTVKGNIHGGYANGNEGQATENSINISGGTVTGNVYGGYGEYVGKNIVNISGGTVTKDVCGGMTEYGKAEENRVSISGDAVTKKVVGGFSWSGEVVKNTVNISGGTVSYVYCGMTESGKAEENRVSISGGTVTEEVDGGFSWSGEVVKNTVNISGGTVKGFVRGGFSGEDNVTGNSVNISGGTVQGNVYGGYTNGANYEEATGNSITLSGTADVRQANLYGGFVDSNRGSVENNKLIINGWSGTVQSINNFNGDDGGIEVKALAGGLDLAADKTTNFITVTGREVKGEDEEDVNHIYIENSEIQKNSKQVKDIQAGVALTVSGEIGISDDNQNIYINPTSVRASDQTAITTESRAAAAAFVNQGAEAVSDSINSLQGAEAGISTFATVSGNNSKYDTGSYVDINGWNGIVGVAKTKDLNAGKFSYGAFFENGGGNYNTYNDFNGTSFRGDGNVVYNGGGLLMRYEQEDGVYTEASLRAGTAKNEVSNALEFTGNRYGFKTENAYYGAHIGIGKIIKLDNGKAWDVYGKYFHTHHEGDSVKIANDVFDFDSVDSDKLRIGARFSEQQGEKLTSYYGLAWEYEFSGDAGGTANHYAMYTPSLEGSTVIGEVGFRYTPGKASPWYFDANVRGYAGMQEGISGSVQAVYSF